MSDPRDPYRGTKPTRPKQPAVKVEPQERDAHDEPTKMRCPCTKVSSHGQGKLGCHICHGEGFITFERWREVTETCPTCAGMGRILHEQRDALDDEAKRREDDE